MKLMLWNYETVLIDEPTNNLDSENIKCIQSAIGCIKDKGANVVIVSHSEKMLEIADIIFKMEEINEAE